MPKLNQRFVDSLPLDGSGRKYADSKIRLYLKQGKRHHTYFLNYERPETGKKSHYHFIGKSKTMTLAEARTAAQQVWVRLDRGLPPIEGEGERRRPWSEIAERFIRHQLTRARARAPRTVADYRRYLLNGPIPTGKDVRMIKRAEWADYADTYKSQFVARQFLQNVSSAMSFAVSKGLADENPIPALIKAYDKPVARDRVLSGLELRLLWQATEDGRGGDYAHIIRLLSLTGCRLREISRLRKVEIDLDAAKIVFPTSRMKNGLVHTSLLSPPAIAILKSVPERDGDFVFGSAGNGFQGESRAQSLLRNRIEKLSDESVATRVAEFGNWTPHDLRRTMYTWLHDNLVAEATINRIFGHSKQGLKKVYASDQDRDLHETRLEAASRQAVFDWANYVMEMIHV